MAVGVLGLIPVLAALAASSWSPRVQAVALAFSLVLILFAAGTGLLRVLALPTTTFLVMLTVGSLSVSQIVRFQWIAAIGALLLGLRVVLGRLMRRTEGAGVLRDALVMGLVLLAIGARDSLGLGQLAVVLLVIDLTLARVGDIGDAAGGLVARVLDLARSSWPPAVTFAGATLAVVADLEATLALGLLAALTWAMLQLAPLFDGHAPVTAAERPRSVMRLVGPALSIACGVAPALILRMLRLSG